MAYQFQNTNTAKDAVFFCESSLARLQCYGDQADNIVNASTRNAEAIATIKRDGLLHIKDFFPREQILAMGEELEQKIARQLPHMTVRNHRAENLSNLETLDIQHITLPSTATAEDAKHYTTGVSLPEPLVQMPSIIDLLGHEQLLDLAVGYYESPPLLTFAKARWAFVNDMGPADTQHWHADPGSFRVLKALIYLNDVDEGGGPFEYIVGSHSNKFAGWDENSRHDEKELRQFYAADKFKTCVARAGDVLFAEVSGFHRGQPPVHAERRILIVNFCVNAEYGLPYQPVKARAVDIEKTHGLHRALFDGIDLV